jgi:hypothetical protein
MRNRRKKGVKSKIMVAFSNFGKRLLPYYYPCAYCSEEECGIDDKEDCEAFISWFFDYDSEDDCINCPLWQLLENKQET